MSVATADRHVEIPVIYRGSPATVVIPLPPIAIRASNSVWQPYTERSSQTLGSSLLAEDSLFKTFFQEVESLQADEDEDTPPDSHALSEVLRLVPFSRSQLAQHWFVPRVASDGFGGVRLSWRKDQREVRAVISGEGVARGNYLYWEDGSAYGTVPNFTPATLFACLDQMEKGTPFER
jgi:hypothetical protein